MKTEKNLYPYILDEKNVLQAIKDVVKNKKKNKSVRRVAENPQKVVKHFYEWLFSDRKPFMHRARVINDGYTAKKRIVIKPYLRTEQVLQHLVVGALKEMFCRGMYFLSCGSVPNRGTHYGKKYIEKYIKSHPENTKYALQLDIRHFYESIDTNLLKERFATYIKDEQFLELVYFVIDSNGAILDGKEISSGLPIGFYTSQWFANWFLQPLDHYIKEELKAEFYVRYMDDMLIFSSSKSKLHEMKVKIEAYLKDLHLQLKANHQVYLFDYIDEKGKRKGRCADFMGFKFYRDKTTIRSKIFIRARRKAKQIRKTGRCTWRDTSQIMSYMGWFSHTDSHKAFEKYIAPNINLNSLKSIARKHSLKLQAQKKDTTKSKGNKQ